MRLTPLTYLLLAVGTLLVGPVVFFLLRRRQGPFAFLDGFVVVAVPGLVLLHVVPEAVAQREIGLALALGAGLMAPGALERLTRDVAGRMDRWALALGVSGLALHAILEGVALRPLSGPDDLAFGLAVALHRVPVGLAIWWLVRERAGDQAALAAVLFVGLLTGAGFWGGGPLAGWMTGGGVELYQAFVGGTLVHVAFHQIGGHESSAPGRVRTALEGLGGILALFLLVGLGSLEGGGGGEGGRLLRHLSSLATVAAPALLGAWGVAGFLGRRTGVDGAAGARVDEVSERGSWITVAAVSLPLLGVVATVLRGALATASGIAARRWSSPEGGTTPVEASHPTPLDGAGVHSDLKRTGGFRRGVEAAVDRDGPVLLAGLLIAAALAPLLVDADLAETPWVPAVLGAGLLGAPWRPGALLVTPTAGVLLAVGFPLGAVLAFLVAALVPRGAGWGSGVPLAVAVAGGLLVEGLGRLLDWAPPVPGPTRLLDTGPDGLAGVALVGVCILMAGSLLRRGARRFVEGGEVGHLHLHDHDHSHPSGEVRSDTEEGALDPHRW